MIELLKAKVINEKSVIELYKESLKDDLTLDQFKMVLELKKVMTLEKIEKRLTRL